MRKRIAVIIGLSSIVFGVLSLQGLSREKIELKFSHKLHVEENELECETCHSGVEESRTGADDFLPNMDVCANCHDVEDAENCGTCHSDTDNPRALPKIESYSKKFSHKRHLSANLECSSCHSEVAAKTNVGAYVLPAMMDCMECHSNKSVSVTCETCHLPGENLRPANHTADFIHNHSDLARNAALNLPNNFTCNTCHKSDFCQKCHEGDNLDRTTHPLNFQFTHALVAQGKERECSVCHTERNFCIECHRDNHVMPHNHVAGWVNPIDGGRHRVEAETDLEACMACHEQNAEQICQTCHGK